MKTRAASGRRTPPRWQKNEESNENRVEPSGPDYDPQLAAMRLLPLATNAILYPCGSSLTLDVRFVEKEIQDAA